MSVREIQAADRLRRTAQKAHQTSDGHRTEQRAVLRRVVRAVRLWVQAGQTQQATTALIAALQQLEDEL